MCPTAYWYWEGEKNTQTILAALNSMKYHQVAITVSRVVLLIKKKKKKRQHHDKDFSNFRLSSFLEQLLATH